jgi:hypothetical protein
MLVYDRFQRKSSRDLLKSIKDQPPNYSIDQVCLFYNIFNKNNN